MLITDEVYPGTSLHLLLQKPLHVGDDAARALSTVERVTLLEKTSYHIRNEDGISHSYYLLSTVLD
jgi:hypothetical protein